MKTRSCGTVERNPRFPFGGWSTPEAADDEVDVMVLLKTTSPWSRGDPEVTVEDTDVFGYGTYGLRQEWTLNYASTQVPKSYVHPERLRNGWFYGLVQQAINDFRSRSPRSDVDTVVRAHGPVVQLDIFNRSRQLLCSKAL